MDPKWSQNGGKISPASFPGGIRKRFGNTDSFFCGFGVPLDPFWHPFRRLLGILGAFRPPSGSLSASLRLSFRQPLEAFRSAENLPRFRRELAEVPPRIRQEPAKNPPCEPQAKLPFILRIFRKRLRPPTNGSIKSPRIKHGVAVSPLGGLNIQGGGQLLSFVPTYMTNGHHRKDGKCFEGKEPIDFVTRTEATGVSRLSGDDFFEPTRR